MDKTVSNDVRQTVAAREAFLQWEQARMIQQFSLQHDDQFLYLPFFAEAYRICRKTGRVERIQADGTGREGDFEEVFSIYDALCREKKGTLSGRYCTVNSLPNVVRSSGLGDWCMTRRWGGSAERHRNWPVPASSWAAWRSPAAMWPTGCQCFPFYLLFCDFGTATTSSRPKCAFCGMNALRSLSAMRQPTTLSPICCGGWNFWSAASAARPGRVRAWSRRSLQSADAATGSFAGFYINKTPALHGKAGVFHNSGRVSSLAKLRRWTGNNRQQDHILRSRCIDQSGV